MTSSIAQGGLLLAALGWKTARDAGIAVAIVFWLATSFWVFKDARRRIADPWLIGLASLFGLAVPFLGPIIYLFFRPPEYLDDVRERELEMRAIEERLADQVARVPRLPRGGRVCLRRLSRLHHPSQAGVLGLRRAAGGDWQCCPFCATPVSSAAPFGDTLETLRAPRRIASD